MGEMASQITSLTIVYSTVYSGADQRKHKSFASLDFVGHSSVTDEFLSQMACNAEMFPYDDVIMCNILDRCHVGLVDAVPVTQYGVTLHVNGLVIWCRYMIGSTFSADYCHTLLYTRLFKERCIFAMTSCIRIRAWVHISERCVCVHLVYIRFDMWIKSIKKINH